MHERGYTSVELLTVVSIIAVLAAISIPGYRDYVASGNRVKVGSGYDVAMRFVQHEYTKATSRIAVGLAPDPPIPNDDAGWIALLNPQNDNAPYGGPAYVSGVGDADSGAIGINTTGDFLDGTAQVILTRPAFGDFVAAVSVTISVSSL